MIKLPVQCKQPLNSPAKRIALGLILVAMLLFAIPSLLSADNEFKRPDVLVLVLGGMGTSEMVSINYTTVVPLPTAQADLDAIAALGKWQATNAKGETKPSGRDAKQSTSITFNAKGIIGYNNGTFPLDPFVTALKRFKYIEIAFLVPAAFQFNGLQDFENDFVKVRLNPSGNAYRYRIVVKDSSFKNADIPLAQPTKQEPEEKSMPLGLRMLLSVGIAIVGAAAVYFVTMYLFRRKEQA